MEPLPLADADAIAGRLARRIGFRVAAALLVVVAAMVGSVQEDAAAERAGTPVVIATVVEAPRVSGDPSWILWTDLQGRAQVAPVPLQRRIDVGGSVKLPLGPDGIPQATPAINTGARATGLLGAGLVLLLGGVALLLTHCMWRRVEAARTGRRIGREWRAVERQWRDRLRP